MCQSGDAVDVQHWDDGAPRDPILPSRPPPLATRRRLPWNARANPNPRRCCSTILPQVELRRDQTPRRSGGELTLASRAAAHEPARFSGRHRDVCQDSPGPPRVSLETNAWSCRRTSSSVIGGLYVIECSGAERRPETAVESSSINLRKRERARAKRDITVPIGWHRGYGLPAHSSCLPPRREEVCCVDLLAAVEKRLRRYIAAAQPSSSWAKRTATSDSCASSRGRCCPRSRGLAGFR